MDLRDVQILARFRGGSPLLLDADDAGLVTRDPGGPLVGSNGEAIALGSAGLSAVTYDGSNRVISFTLSGVTYTLAYSSSTIIVTGSNGSSVTVALDGSGRITGVS